MSLGGVKQIVYMQNDFTAYMIGNIMYNLANRIPIRDAQGVVSTLPGAPVPIPASEIGLAEFKMLNDENLKFADKMSNADQNDLEQAFFVSHDGTIKDFSPSITSFLCTDRAYEIFDEGGKKLDTLALHFPKERFPGEEKILTNEQCLKEAREFYKYADVEGYRGSPHKL